MAIALPLLALTLKPELLKDIEFIGAHPGELIWLVGLVVLVYQTLVYVHGWWFDFGTWAHDLILIHKSLLWFVLPLFIFRLFLNFEYPNIDREKSVDSFGHPVLDGPGGIDAAVAKPKSHPKGFRAYMEVRGAFQAFLWFDVIVPSVLCVVTIWKIALIIDWDAAMGLVRNLP